MLKTYKEWQEEGKHVRKGEHAFLCEEGNYYFNETQVEDIVFDFTITEDTILKTYREWASEGRYVIKGEHACYFKNGKYYFNQNQVMTLEEVTKRKKELINRKYEACEKEVKGILECVPKGEFATLNKSEAYNWLGAVGGAISAKHHNNLDDRHIDILESARIANGWEDNILHDLM